MHPLLGPWEPFSIPLGPVSIHGFGILVAVGFLVGQTIAMAKARQLGGDAEAVNRLVGWLVVGTFVGGHLGHVLWYEPHKLAGDPAMFQALVGKLASGHLPKLDDIPYILRVWDGLSSFGGFAVCVPLAVWFFYREKKPFFPHGDALAIGFTAGWFFGRMGCFSAHDHPGTPTNFWLGVYGMCEGHNPDVACHDLGLYEALFTGALFVTLMLLSRRPRFPGFYCAAVALSYAPFRLFLDLFRSSSVDVRYAGLTPAQYGTLLLFLVGVFIVVNQRGKPTLPATVPA